MSWTQPLCKECYAIAEPGRTPILLRDQTVEKCCICGTETDQIVWYRLDPKTVRFPKVEK